MKKKPKPHSHIAWAIIRTDPDVGTWIDPNEYFGDRDTARRFMREYDDEDSPRVAKVRVTELRPKPRKAVRK